MSFLYGYVPGVVRSALDWVIPDDLQGNEVARETRTAK